MNRKNESRIPLRAIVWGGESLELRICLAMFPVAVGPVADLPSVCAGADLVAAVMIQDRADESGRDGEESGGGGGDELFTPLEAKDSPPWLQAPELPAPTGNVIEVASESELQAAMSNLQAGTTIVLAPGVYQLTKTLWVRQDDVTIRGETNDHDDVVLVGKGMDNANFGRVAHGIWSNASKTRIQNLTIRDVYHHPIQFAETATAPHIYNVKMLDAGEQFVKASRGNGTGIVGGIVEYSIMEYTNGPPKTNHGGGLGYTNGVDVHGGQGWLVRNNLFKNFHTPDNARHLWNPAVLFWNQARDTIVEGNTFMNVDRAIALGLVDRTPADHAGGIIRNNFIYQEPNLFSPSRQTNSDGQILVWDSENTKVYHNTVLTNGNSRRAIEFRWATRGSLAVNNLSDAPIGKRSGATYVASGNQLNATPEMFVDPENGNLHLKQDEGVAIDAVDAPPEAATDIDGQVRPGDGKADVGADEKSAALANARPVISVSPVRDELLENDPREEGLLVATFAVVDDELGTNHVWLAGEDAAKFVISGEDVFLKSGVSLDFEMNPVLELSVLVDDPSIGAAVDAQQEINLRIVDVNEPPRLQVVGLLEMVSEGEDLLSGLKVADVYVLDDALGDNQLSLDGEDAEGFELRGSELLIKSGVVLDFESKPLLELTVSVNDLEMGNGVDDFVDVQIGVISLNVPIVDLDADNSSGDSGFVAEFRAGTEPVLIADDDFRLIDPNGRDLIEATVTIANSLPGDRLQLLGRLSGPIEIDLSSTESTFRLVGKASVSAYRETLSHLSYYNPTDIRNTDDRIVTVQVTNDLGLESVLESALVKVRRSLPTWLQAPDLPAPTGNVVAVSSEPELQAAMSNLQAGTTIVLAPGVYQLTKTLWVRQDDVTIRGQTNDHDDVVLIGKGMDNANFGRVPHGIWSNASKTRIQNLTILNVYHHPIQFAETAHAPHVYNVLMLNAGEQFVKASRGNGTGIVGGIVEYSIMEYTNGPPKTNHGGGIGYTNGVDVHGGQGWLVRNNLFKNFHTPDNARHLWNPAVLFWNQARDTIVEGNTFINVDRAIALGLVDRTPADHAGGIIRNNFIYQEPDLFSPSRQTNSDGQILVWDSENTKVYHNTVLTNGNSRRAIEFRWSTRGSLAVNNLSDAPIGKRSGATYVASGNQLNATPEMFVDPENGNLHLKQDEGAAIDVVDAPPEAATDIDGQVRPGDGKADVGADQRREPFADLYGDVNLDAVVDSRDIDELSRHVRSGDYRESSDLNRDGVLSELDRETLVLKVLDSAFGDSSLDGIFSSSDLVKAFQAGEYEDELVGNSTWSTGDWNGDGEFTSADFIMAFQAGGYVNGARSA